MKKLKRQDRNGTRTSEELRRRYKLGQIELTQEEMDKLKAELVVDTTLSATSSNAIANRAVTEALNNKVTKVEGKDLSSNDFTDANKQKLDGLNTNAEANVIENIKVNGTLQTVTDKTVNIEIPDDKFTATFQQQVENNTLARHTHTNKSVLDTYTFTQEELIAEIIRLLQPTGQ